MEYTQATPLRIWATRFGRQLRRVNPFNGDCLPTRVLLFRFGRPSLPFPHLWNYREPIRILDAFFWDADRETGSGKHNRYLDAPGMPHVLVTREPAIIRAVLSATGDKPGQFDRDTSPTSGIARATGEDSLLYANGALWRRQKRLAAPPFNRSSLFQRTFRKGHSSLRVRIRPAGLSREIPGTAGSWVGGGRFRKDLQVHGSERSVAGERWRVHKARRWRPGRP